MSFWQQRATLGQQPLRQPFKLLPSGDVVAAGPQAAFINKISWHFSFDSPLFYANMFRREVLCAALQLMLNLEACMICCYYVCQVAQQAVVYLMQDYSIS